MFWIERPTAETPLAIAEKAKLAFLGQFSPFRDNILRDHQIDLEAVPGVGYRVIPPNKQTQLAYADGVNDIRKGMRKMLTRIACVDVKVRTEDERRENADTMVKAAMMRSMIRKAKRLSDLRDDE